MAGSRLLPQNVKKLVRRMTGVVLPLNNEHGGKGFAPENEIKNPWVVIFNLWFVPKNPADALNDPANVSNNAADVPNNPTDGLQFRRMRQIIGRSFENIRQMLLMIGQLFQMIRRMF
jgi:hypothetical protein